MKSVADYKILSEIRGFVGDDLERTGDLVLAVSRAAPETVRPRLEKMLSCHGKRIRAMLLLLLAKSGPASSPDRAVRAAASIELLHLASLVHDDVIDQTETRRGEPTVHALWGNRAAVLLGDYALAKSLELVVDDEDSRIPLTISRASGQLVAGELLELQLAGSEVSLKQYEEIVAGKTAALVEASTVCGGVIAGHGPETVAALAQLGRDVGFGFQMIDDLLDFGIGAGNLGKAKHTDLANGVMTLPTILYLESASPDEARAMRGLLREVPLDHGRVPQVVALLEKSGAFDRARAVAREHIDRATETVLALPPWSGRDALLKLIGAMLHRSF